MTGHRRDRDTTIDILRGIAIFTMVASNLSTVALQKPHPFWFRFYGTFAAPLFILLSGFMVSYTMQRKSYTFKYFANRGVILLVTAALLDVLIFNIFPFSTVDVLYLIAVSYPLAYIFQSLNSFQQLLIISSIFSLTPVLQNILGYAAHVTEIGIFSEEVKSITSQDNILNILKHWLVDGWFPLFPWLGFSFLGVFFAKLRRFYISFAHKSFLLGGGAIFVVGAIAWWFYPGEMLVRNNYSELFYPPTTGYIITAIGIITILFSVVDYNPFFAMYNPLKVLGESSLFIYILHYAIIIYFIEDYLSNQKLPIFIGIYLVIIALILVIAYSLRFLKLRLKKYPHIVKFLIGG